MSIPCMKRCLVYVVWVDYDLVVTALQIDLRKEFDASESIQQLINAG